jgi:DNA-directed RNA polymerase specialized sigma24 family protein
VPETNYGGLDRHEEFVRQWSAHRDHLYSLVFAMLPDHVEAEEIFQRVSVVLWTKFDSLEPGTSFWHWAARCRGLVRNYTRSVSKARIPIGSSCYLARSSAKS